MIDKLIADLEDDESRNRQYLISEEQRKLILNALNELKIRRGVNYVDVTYVQPQEHKHCWELVHSSTGGNTYKCKCGQWKTEMYSPIYNHWWMG